MARKVSFVLAVLMLLASAMAARSVWATSIDVSKVFDIPAVGVPVVACVTDDNGTPGDPTDDTTTCNPSPGTNPMQIAVQASLSEASGVGVAEGPATPPTGAANCDVLNKNISFQVVAGDTIDVFLDTDTSDATGPTNPVHHTESKNQSRGLRLCIGNPL